MRILVNEDQYDVEYLVNVSSWHGDYLFVHPLRLRPRFFSIGHAPTGYTASALAFLSLGQAREIADLMAEGYDWNFSDPADLPMGVKAFFWKQCERLGVSRYTT